MKKTTGGGKKTSDIWKMQMRFGGEKKVSAMNNQKLCAMNSSHLWFGINHRRDHWSLTASTSSIYHGVLPISEWFAFRSLQHCIAVMTQVISPRFVPFRDVELSSSNDHRNATCDQNLLAGLEVAKGIGCQGLKSGPKQRERSKRCWRCLFLDHVLKLRRPVPKYSTSKYRLFNMSGSLKEDGGTERAVVSWWWDTTSGISWITSGLPTVVRRRTSKLNRNKGFLIYIYICVCVHIHIHIYIYMCIYYIIYILYIT